MKSNDIKLLSSNEDEPRLAKGLLIPPFSFSSAGGYGYQSNYKSNESFLGSLQLAISVLGVFTFIMISVSGYVFINNTNLQAAPIVTLVDSVNNNSIVLEYGEQPLLDNLTLFEDTQNSFIEYEVSFISVNLEEGKLRFFDKGVLLYDFQILDFAENDTWRALKSGLYNTKDKQKNFVSFANRITYPWAILFENNFIISAQPTLVGRSDSDFASVELMPEDAEKLYKKIKKGTPILVYLPNTSQVDDFYYQLKAPSLSTQNFIIADIENNSILSAGSEQAVVPIASLAKLMTALIVSEKLSLDSRIKVSNAGSGFATSLIPRLTDKDTVSVYSLLQLLLKESSNEAAEVLAGEIGRDEFITAMNDKVKELGMSDTIFADPSGLSADNISSPQDLLKLISYLFYSKKFIIDITIEDESQTSYVANEFSGLQNFNQLEGFDNLIGGKVGETRAAGHTSITLHRVKMNNEDRILAVILLNTKQRQEDIKNLIDYVRDRYK